MQLTQVPGIIGIDFTAGTPQSEDCLRLSVNMPDDVTDGSPLPVIVWIHGGGCNCRAGDASAYDPAFLVREQQIVFVSVMYRLGVLGCCGSTPGRGTWPSSTSERPCAGCSATSRP